MDTKLISWIQNELRADDVQIVGRLGGSSSATISEVRIRSLGQLRLAVAKVFDRPVVSAAVASEHVLLESDRLRRVTALPVPTPEPLAVDAMGRHVGSPTILMTRLLGRPVLRPSVPSWIDGLANTLRSIASNGALDVQDLPTAESWRDPALPRPDWFADAGLWMAANDRADAGLIGSTPRLLHRDFHPGNVLWDRGLVSGVVDWLHACLGPIEIDIASCRVNIALTAGLEAADEFVVALGELGATYDRAWDLDKVLSLAEYSEVLLTGNELGAELDMTHVHDTLVDVTRAALH